jgi:hypothetical protein
MTRSTRRVLASIVTPALRAALGTPLAGAVLAACSSGSPPIGQVPVVGMVAAERPDAAVQTEPMPRPGIPDLTPPVAPGTVSPDPPRPGIVRPAPPHSELRPGRGSRRAIDPDGGGIPRTGFAGGGPRRLS